MAVKDKIVCRYCRKNLASKDRALWPFCSERCKSLDFGGWVKGAYRVPGEEVEGVGGLGEDEQGEDELDESGEDEGGR